MNDMDAIKKLANHAHNLNDFERLSACLKGIHYLALKASEMMESFRMNHDRSEVKEHQDRLRQIYELIVIETSYA